MNSFEEYGVIIKTTILLGFKEDELNGFYDAIKIPCKIALFEAENKEVFDIIASYKDFEKFKVMMINMNTVDT
jgi:hypothetical protein